MKANLKDKTICVYDYGLFLSLAITLAPYFKRVYYFTPWKTAYPKLNDQWIGDGLEDEGVYRINDFWDHIEEYDCVAFPDILDGDLQLELEALDIPVWGSKKGEELEMNRVDTKKWLKKHGFPVYHYEVIKGISAVKKYLEENKGTHFIKIDTFRGTFETFKAKSLIQVNAKFDELARTLGPYQEKVDFIIEDALDDDDVVELAYDGYTIDGQYPDETIFGYEVKGLGYIGTVKKYDKLPDFIKKLNAAIAPEFKKYQYRNFCPPEIRVGKKTEPTMIDWCVSEDTEVLTNNGWKFFKDCTIEDQFATLSLKNGQIEYQYATDYNEQFYNGKMVHISNKNRSIDCLVSPNHQVLRTDRNKKSLFKQSANSLTDKGFIPRTGIWNGVNEEYYELPEYNNEWDFVGEYGNLICTKFKKINAAKIAMKDWAAFLGWYLSEGSLSSKYIINISQTKNVSQLKSVLDRLPFNYSYDGKSFRIGSLQLCIELEKFGLCDQKFIPDYIKSASKEVISEFLFNFRLGDGGLHGSGARYFTTSKQLADDIQECVFKAGSVCNIELRKSKGTIANIQGKQYTRNHDIYIITERRSFSDFWFETGVRKSQYINEVDYDGKIYCVTVPNSTIYVRRNGRPFWTGNCTRFPSPPSEIYHVIIDNLAEIVYYGAQGKMIQPEYKAKYAMEAVVHSDWAEKEWQEISFPKEIKEWIKLRNFCKVDGRYYIVPYGDGSTTIGAVVAIGDSLDECHKKLKSYADKLDGYRLDIEVDAIDRAYEYIEKGKKLGIEF